MEAGSGHQKTRDEGRTSRDKKVETDSPTLGAGLGDYIFCAHEHHPVFTERPSGGPRAKAESDRPLENTGTHI